MEWSIHAISRGVIGSEYSMDSTTPHVKPVASEEIKTSPSSVKIGQGPIPMTYFHVTCLTHNIEMYHQQDLYKGWLHK